MSMAREAGAGRMEPVSKEKKLFEPKDPLIWNLLYFQDQLDAYDAFDAQKKAKGTDDFAALEEEWKFKTKDVSWLQENKLPKELFAIDKDEEPETPPDPDSYLEINKSRESVQKKYDELFDALEAKGMTEDEINAELDAAAKAFKAERRALTAPEPGPSVPPAPEPSPVISPPLPDVEPVSATPEPVRLQPPAPEPVQPEHGQAEPPLPEARGGVIARPEAWMGTWDAWTGGKAPTGPDAVEKIKRYAESVAKSQGKNTLAYAYAESLLKSVQGNIQEGPARQQAELHREEIAQLEAEQTRINQRLTELRNPENNTGAFAEPVDGRISQLEREIAEKQRERQALLAASALGAGFQRGVNNAYDRATTVVNRDRRADAAGNITEQTPQRGWFKRMGGFLSERVKGLATAGWWEIHQAGKFRKGTKEVAREMETQSKLLELESPYFAVSTEQVRYNQIVEDKIVKMALQKLEDNLKNKSWIEQYKAAHGGAVITPEKMVMVESKLRERLAQLRSGQVDKDTVNFLKTIRRTLDKAWWSRYVYGGVEAALWAGAFWKWIWPKASEWLTGGGGGAPGPGNIPGPESVNVPGGILENPWSDTENVIDDFLKNRDLTWDDAIDKLNLRDIHGNPVTTKNQLIQLYDTWATEDSNIAVPEWGVKGGSLATKLSRGFPMNYGRVINSLLRLSAF